jgi:hypothetical protein
MSKPILTLTERIANVSPIGISNFQTFYELAILFMSLV